MLLALLCRSYCKYPWLLLFLLLLLCWWLIFDSAGEFAISKYVFSHMRRTVHPWPTPPIRHLRSYVCFSLIWILMNMQKKKNPAESDETNIDTFEWKFGKNWDTRNAHGNQYANHIASASPHRIDGSVISDVSIWAGCTNPSAVHHQSYSFGAVVETEKWPRRHLPQLRIGVEQVFLVNYIIILCFIDVLKRIKFALCIQARYGSSLDMNNGQNVFSSFHATHTHKSQGVESTGRSATGGTKRHSKQQQCGGQATWFYGA